MKNFLTILFIFPSFFFGLLLHANFPKPTTAEDLRASKLFHNPKNDLSSKENKALEELLEYAEGIESVETTANLLWLFPSKEMWIYGDENGNLFPESKTWKQSEPRFVILPKAGNFCKTFPKWSCDFEFIEGKVDFENDYFRVIESVS